MKENQSKQKKPIYKRWWFVIIVIVVIIGLVNSISGDNEKQNSQSNDLSNSNDSNTNEPSNNQDESKQDNDNNKETDKDEYVNTAETVELFTGEFLVGTDVKAGRYDITCTSGSGNFFVYDGEMPIVNEILASSMMKQ